MSLFDPPTRENITDVFAIGEPIKLDWAEYKGVIETTFGMREAGEVLVRPIDGTEEDARHFTVFGNLAKQIEAMDEGEIPCIVTIEKKGKGYVWAAAG